VWWNQIGPVDSEVPELADEVQLLADRDTGLGLECHVVDPGRQVVLVREQ
jgi:hypothetical protein